VSIALVIIFTLVRVYFAVVVCAFARTSILRAVALAELEHGDDDGNGEARKSRSSIPNDNHGPFAQGESAGKGWKGTVGRVMVSVGKGYWLRQAEGEDLYA
jgi:hypothetical protein